ncbi:sensor histidine kinase [Sphingobacterium yanglingense]|uniref:histidine kinase n=1 Tax=Sphingobacterium yanglingense TaxID=1437280 RepID=A0A4R6W837_9SPHI|nr:HAMP domain-containing sensor histidine kinase [Sphingobacterium yanglingense]TDQ73786.1 signal transduction histidine kinase [Sphingobacterium yanglingense]
MKRIRNYWETLTHIGTDASMSYMDFKRAHMVNMIALLCILPTVYFSITNLFEQRPLLALINFSNGLCDLVVLLLQYRRKHHYAKLTLLSSNFIFFFAGAILYQNGAEYFLLCILISSTLLYDDRRIHLLFALAVTIAMVFIYTSPNINTFEQPVPVARVLYNIICSIIFIVVSVNFFLQIIYSNMKKIEDQRRSLHAINKDKEKIFSIIAHDIKSPFATLETMAVALEQQVLNDSISPDFMRQLRLRIVQQNQVLDDLLQWGSSSLRGIANAPTPLMIKPIVNDILITFEEQILVKQLNLKISIPEEEQVLVNKDHLTIILRNFISNAIKFSYVTGEIHIFTSTEKEFTFIHIKDQGIGINPSKSALLFNEIQRKSLGTGDEPGAGVGLILCKDLIERNQGIVHIQSTPNKGSVFTVGLPTHLKGELNSNQGVLETSITKDIPLPKGAVEKII